MKIEFLTPNAPTWTEFINTIPHDFYHLPEYVELEARRMQGEPIAIYAEDEGRVFLLPLILRSIQSSDRGDDCLRDAISPYGYPCPLQNVQADEAQLFIQAILPKVKDYLNELGVVSVFVRLHPLFHFPGSLDSFGKLIKHGETIWIDLRLSEEELWRQIRKTLRQNIGTAQRSGATAMIDENWEHFDRFVEIYTLTMNRVSATEYYYFDKAYFTGLRQALGERIKLCVVDYNGVEVAAGLFSECCGIVQAHLAGSDASLGQPHAFKLMLNFIIGWAKQRGNHAFNIGGGLGAQESSLSFFKAGFSDLRNPFYTWRWIINQSEYSRLVADWVQRTGLQPDDDSGYFPAYRKEFHLSEENEH